MNINPINAIDFYKSGHIFQYPKNTQFVYSNFTPRSGKHSNTDLAGIIFFGLQGFIKEFLIDAWNKGFFSKNRDKVVESYKRRMDFALGKDVVSVDHIKELWELGYLPIKIKALQEGTFVPYNVPVLTIINTDERFFWLTNYLESVMSAALWKASTSATTAYTYKKEFIRHARKTGSPLDFINWQGHDFSFRGMGGIEDAARSGAGHLTSFYGTDTVPAIDYVEEYYNASVEKDFICGSVGATEHSVMCMGTKENEIDTYRRLITEIYPSGIVSIVSDTWDFWKVISKYSAELKETILAREGRLVYRPDSGNPEYIICGDPNSENEIIKKGAYEVLCDIFGYEMNEKGYKVMNPKVGLIYGDSITLSIQKNILSRLEEKGYCASNLVLGIGSYTYQYCTRDTHGFAMKATWGMVDNEEKSIFKDPITDDGLKKSAKGLLKVFKDNDGTLKLKDEVSPIEEMGGELKCVFENGIIVKEVCFSDIRKNINLLLGVQ